MKMLVNDICIKMPDNELGSWGTNIKLLQQLCYQSGYLLQRVSQKGRAGDLIAQINPPNY